MYYSLFLTAISAATCKIILVISHTYTPTQSDINLKSEHPHTVILTISKTCIQKSETSDVQPRFPVYNIAFVITKYLVPV